MVFGCDGGFGREEEVVEVGVGSTCSADCLVFAVVKSRNVVCDSGGFVRPKVSDQFVACA